MRAAACGLVGLALMAGGGVRAQETLATSRLVTVYTTPSPATVAASRLVSAYITEDVPGTQGLSRSVTAYIVPDPVSTQAASREVTAWLGFSLQNAATALRIAAGLHAATPREAQLFNLITAAPSTDIVDILDAYSVARYAINPSQLP